jgi:hypothetical protein
MTTLHKLLTHSFALLATVATGCMDSGEEGDGIDDSFIGDGKSDAFGIAEGSPDALGVIAVLRTASYEELDNEAMLSANAAKAILNHRQGGDRKDGTADDDVIDSLTELDGIPYVGPMAFKLLLDHARAKGAVPSADPFSDDFCGLDYAVTMGQVRAVLGSDSAIVLQASTSGMRVRTRVCVTPDNCPAWEQGSAPIGLPAGQMFMVDGDTQHTAVNVPAAGIEATPGVALATDGRPILWFGTTVQAGDGTSARSAELDLQCYPGEVPTDESIVSLPGCHMMLDEKVLHATGAEAGSVARFGERCAQVILRRQELGAQREVVFFARY